MGTCQNAQFQNLHDYTLQHKIELSLVPDYHSHTNLSQSAKHKTV